MASTTPLRAQALTFRLPEAVAAEVRQKLSDWDAQGGTRRLFAGDASLWTGADEASWLGWLTIVEEQFANLASLKSIREEAGREGFRHVLLLGMGGSSLCPEVWKETFGTVPGCPELFVLDSTDPAQIRDVEGRIDIAGTPVRLNGDVYAVSVAAAATAS